MMLTKRYGELPTVFCMAACKKTERKSNHIAPSIIRIVSKRSHMDHSFTAN